MIKIKPIYFQRKNAILGTIILNKTATASCCPFLGLMLQLQQPGEIQQRLCFHQSFKVCTESAHPSQKVY